jgi:metal-sulfur cluster biosynthetic enzyme
MRAATAAELCRVLRVITSGPPLSYDFLVGCIASVVQFLHSREKKASMISDSMQLACELSRGHLQLISNKRVLFRELCALKQKVPLRHGKDAGGLTPEFPAVGPHDVRLQVDLGLVYDIDVNDDESGNGKRNGVKMTLTAPGCGMDPTLARDAEQRILTVPGVASAFVELVWDPPWSPERISQAGREKLGMV